MSSKGILITFLVCIFIAVGIFIITLFKPNSEFAMFIYSWRYRKLRRLYSDYQWSQRQTPPHSYEHFKKNAIHSLQDTRQIHETDLIDIVMMLDVDGFIRYYFDNNVFNAETYRMMMDDYRSGLYKTKEYDKIKILKQHLPPVITNSNKAFDDFMKLVNAGWFDAETGMYLLDNRKKYQIGLAIKWFCKYNGISAPEKVFAPVFNEKPETIKEWLRGSEYNDRNNETQHEIDVILGRAK